MRPFQSSARLPSLFRFTSSMAQPRFSAGTDTASATPALNALLTSEGGRWTLAKDGTALERLFKFKTFGKTWDFMTGVSLQCKIKNHHPEWSNVGIKVYNTTFIRWTTHNPAGLSDKDITMATQCDALAAQLGELPPEPEISTAEVGDQSCAIRGLADQAAGAAGDCCTPKSK
ncbi:pterin-4-alpha-carbinolamine dehydratase [Fusarium sporotrichioides]|uniref:4a-hydroxytetrahydrobiopterin dehydratase n=1 Tax=Fusarium sporotrichioides TaxID=5514 RepID=A0A395RXN2_FUSSP|nr:pterin-4-alpha-carbinolamine dehydratase [Fusarium sporotrichioides]